jgi:hypothetical protein
MPVDRTNLKLRAFNRKRARFGEDVCTLLGPSQVSDGHSGHKLTHVALATEVKCFVEQSGSGAVTVEREGVSRTTTHKITMEGTDAARLINEHYQIKVLAREGGNPEMLFEWPVRDIGSFDPLVVVQAVFTSGVRRPAAQ